MSELPATHELTALEIQLLGLKALGFTYPEIAHLRGRALQTICCQAHNIMWKLDARSITEAAVKAWFQGLIH